MRKPLSLLHAALGARYPWLCAPPVPYGRRIAGLPDGLPRRRLDRYRLIPPAAGSARHSAHGRKLLRKTLRRQPPMSAGRERLS